MFGFFNNDFRTTLPYCFSIKPGYLQMNIAIIGCGYWGDKILQTCRVIESITNIKLFEISPIRKAAIQKQNPDIQFYDTLSAIEQDLSVNAVIIATELSTHFDLTKRLLQTNKHVFCEKPLAQTANECEVLGEIAETNSLILMVGHTYLYNETIAHAKKLLNNGNIGIVQQLHFQRCNFGPIRYDTDVIYDLATHDIAIANFLLTDVPISVSATGNRILKREKFDSCNIHLNYPNDVSVDIFVSWIEPIKTRIMKIMGNQGCFYFDEMASENNANLYRYKTTLSSDIDESGRDQLIYSEQIEKPKNSPLYNELYHFVTCVLNNKKPISDWSNGLNVVKVIEAIEKSVTAHGCIVKV